MYYYIYIRICVFVFENSRTNGPPLSQCHAVPVELPTVKVRRVENGNVNVFRVNVAANTLADGDLRISRKSPTTDDQGLLRSSVVHF